MDIDMNFKDFENKKVQLHIETKNGLRYYTGTINKVTFLGKNIDGIDNYFFSMTDKFGSIIGFSSTQIKLIEEVK